MAVKGVLKPYYVIRTSWPVWFYVLNMQGRRLFKESGHTLNVTEKQVVQDLKHNGIALTSLKELFPESDMLQVLQEYSEQLMPHAKRHPDKTFLVRVFESKLNYDLDYDNPFTKLVVSDRVLGVVNSYMEMFSRFFYYSLNLTTPVPGASPMKSQRWHRDNEDKKMCKVFIYLTDVDENSGPFTYVPGSQHGGKWRTVLPPRPPRSFYPPEGEVERLIPRSEMKICTGKAGTVIFCDTSGLHYGGYASKNNRLMFTAEYSSKASFILNKYEIAPNLKERLPSLSKAAQFALSKQLGLLHFINVPSRLSIRYNLF